MGRFNIKKLLDNRIARTALIIICSVTLIYSLFRIGSDLFYSWRSSEILENLQNKQYVRKSFHDASFDSLLRSITPVSGSPENGISHPYMLDPEVLDKYLDLLLINEDIVGWIKVPGTDIDYPIVQGRDNEQYMTMTYTGENNRHGAIFMDYRNNRHFSDKNTVIYGHNMKLPPYMFRPLELKYRDEEFFYGNRIIQVDSIYEEQKWEVFSAYVSEATFGCNRVRFGTPEEFSAFVQTIKEKSLFPTDTEISEDDCILTLSTCSYDFDDARFVVHAKRIKDDR